jgi:hypothetical protein
MAMAETFSRNRSVDRAKARRHGDEMSIAIGLYVYVIIGLIIATALDRYFMRGDVPYGFAPSGLPLAGLRIGAIIGLTVMWPAVVYDAIRAMVKIAWHEIQVLRRAKRMYGHRS